MPARGVWCTGFRTRLPAFTGYHLSMKTAVFAVLLLSLFLIGCRQLSTASESGVTVAAPVVPVAEAVVRGVHAPVDLAFLSPEILLVAEAQPACIRWVEHGVLRPAPFAELGDETLVSLAVAPNYPHTPYVYACTARRVVRFTVAQGAGTAPTTLIDNLPGGGGRLLFARDGALLLTTGDAGHPDWAQDYTKLVGKVLRYAADGSVPDDNPLEEPQTHYVGHDANDADVTSEHTKTPVYAVGLRHPTALVQHPETGALYVLDTEPGRDLLCHVVPGDNYALSTAGADDPHFHPPLWSAHGIAPVAAAFYAGQEFPLFAGDLFFTAADGKLRRLALAGRDRVAQVAEVPNLGAAACGALAMGPDGRLYFTDHDAVYRLRVQRL